MPCSDSASLVCAIVLVTCCVGVGMAPELATIARGLWARAGARFRRRTRRGHS